MGKEEKYGYSYNVRVGFPTERLAGIACSTLSVDKEPRGGMISKVLHCEGQVLCVEFESTSAKLLRVSVNSFYDLLALVMETMDGFDVVIGGKADMVLG